MELLLADKRSFDSDQEHWRAGEVRLVADRIAELIADGECLPGQVVLLFEAGTDAVLYEGALRRRGLRTVRTTGGGYYAQQQVADILGYLRLLRNRYDDFALLGVLASPLVGISNDGLLALRRGAVRRPIFTALERDELPEGLSPDEQRLVAAFKQRLARLSTRLGEVGLERLIDLVVAEHDYDLACLAQPDGDRRLANVVKLARMAGSYEALRGPDLEGFIGFCDEQAVAGDARGRGGHRRGGRAGGGADDHARRQGTRIRCGGAGGHRSRADGTPGRRHSGGRAGPGGVAGAQPGGRIDAACTGLE